MDEHYGEISEDVSELKSAINSAPTEATGLALLEDETANTTLLLAVLDNIDVLIANLPQDSSLENIVTELQTENAWLETIYLEAAARLEETA